MNPMMITHDSGVAESPAQLTVDSSRLAERRTLLSLAAWMGVASSARALLASPAEGVEMDLAAFVREAVPLAEALLADKSRIGQDRYLHTIAALAVQLRDIPLPEMRETSKDLTARTFLGAHEFDAPFTILHWRLEPGARIALHPHIYGNVVTLCLGGEVHIENYEMVGERDFDREGPFEVRRVHDQVLTPGDVNLVSLEHSYMHGFVAGPEGAHGLDITTRIRDKRPTPTLIVSPQAIDAERRIFEGRWQKTW